jgi:hypothetical protein
MATTPEGRVKAAIKKFLKTVPDCWFFMPIGGPYTTHGIPDIVGVVQGKFFSIECKAPGKERNTTNNQEMVMGMISCCGGIAFVASSVAVVRDRFIEEGFYGEAVEGANAVRA